jgi:hypothetical protein
MIAQRCLFHYILLPQNAVAYGTIKMHPDNSFIYSSSKYYIQKVHATAEVNCFLDAIAVWASCQVTNWKHQL